MLPLGNGNNPTFGTVHIAVLAICLAAIGICIALLVRFKPSVRFTERCLLIIGIVSETIKVFSYIIANEETHFGYLPKTDLPFHLCSIQILFVLILNLTSNQKLKRALYSFMLPSCLLGGFFALLLPTSSARNAIVICIQYFLYHSAIMLFAINLLLSKEIKFTVKDYLTSLKVLFAFAFIAIYLNSWVVPATDYAAQRINFMYVVAPPMEGLPFLNKDHGWIVYIAHYGFLAVFCVTLCYIKLIIEWFKSRKKKD